MHRSCWLVDRCSRIVHRCCRRVQRCSWRVHRSCRRVHRCSRRVHRSTWPLHRCCRPVHRCSWRVHRCCWRVHRCSRRVHRCRRQVHRCSSRAHRCCWPVHRCCRRGQRSGGEAGGKAKSGNANVEGGKRGKRTWKGENGNQRAGADRVNGARSQPQDFDLFSRGLNSGSPVTSSAFFSVARAAAKASARLSR